MGISITRSSSAPPPLDPNPSMDIKKKKKQKQKKQKKKKLRTAIRTRAEPKGEKPDLLANRINISISPKLRTLTATRVEPEKRAMEGREEIQEKEKGATAFVIAPEVSLSTTAEETNPAPICPICYEDMDVMDVSFCSCECGFKLCLFCYNNIVQRGDDRCPRCRVSYRFSL